MVLGDLFGAELHRLPLAVFVLRFSGPLSVARAGGGLADLVEPRAELPSAVITPCRRCGSPCRRSATGRPRHAHGLAGRPLEGAARTFCTCASVKARSRWSPAPAPYSSRSSLGAARGDRRRRAGGAAAAVGEHQREELRATGEAIRRPELGHHRAPRTWRQTTGFDRNDASLGARAHGVAEGLHLCGEPRRGGSPRRRS